MAQDKDIERTLDVSSVVGISTESEVVESATRVDEKGGADQSGSGQRVEGEIKETVAFDTKTFKTNTTADSEGELGESESGTLSQIQIVFEQQAEQGSVSGFERNPEQDPHSEKETTDPVVYQQDLITFTSGVTETALVPYSAQDRPRLPSLDLLQFEQEPTVRKADSARLREVQSEPNENIKLLESIASSSQEDIDPFLRLGGYSPGFYWSCLNYEPLEVISEEEDSDEEEEGSYDLETLEDRVRVKEKATIWEENPRLKIELQEWRNRYERLEEDLLRLREEQKVIKKDTTYKSLQQSASYDVATSSKYTVVTYNTKQEDIEESSEVVSSELENINDLLKQQVDLLSDANESLCNKVERLSSTLSVKEKTNERFRTSLDRGVKTLHEAQNLISEFKRDFGGLRGFVVKSLAEYSNTLAAERNAVGNWRSDMDKIKDNKKAEKESIDVPQGGAEEGKGEKRDDDTMTEVSNIEVTEEIIEAVTRDELFRAGASGKEEEGTQEAEQGTDMETHLEREERPERPANVSGREVEEDTLDTMGLPKISVHSGSMTQDELEMSISRLAGKNSIQGDAIEYLYSGLEKLLPLLQVESNKECLARLLKSLKEKASVSEVLSLLEESMKIHSDVDRVRDSSSRSRSPIGEDDHLPMDTIFQNLRYEAKIKDLQHQIEQIAAEKQRLANELNKHTGTLKSLQSGTDNMPTCGVGREHVVFDLGEAGTSGVQTIEAEKTSPYPEETQQSGTTSKDHFNTQLSEPSSLSEESGSRWCSEIQSYRDHINILQKQLEQQKQLCHQLLSDKQHLFTQLANLRDEKRNQDLQMSYRNREQQQQIQLLIARYDQLSSSGAVVERKDWGAQHESILHLRDDLEKLYSEVSHLSEENSQLKEKSLATSQDWLTLLQKRSTEYRKLEIEKQSLEKALEETTEDKEAYQREVDTLQAKLLHLTKEICANREELVREKALKEESESMVHHLDAELEKIRKFYEEQAERDRQCHQQATEQLKSGYESQISELRGRFKTTTEEYNQRLKQEMYPVLDEFSKMNLNVTEMEAELVSLKAQLERERQESATLRESLQKSKQQFNQLTSEASDWRRRQDEFNHKVERLTLSSSKSQKEQEEISQTNLKLRSELEKKNLEVTQLEADRLSLEKQCMKLREERNTITNELQAEMRELQEQLQGTVQDREVLTSQLTEMRHEEESLKAKVASLENELFEKRSTIEALQKQIDGLHIDLKDVKSQLTSSRLEIESYIARIQVMEGQRRELLESKERLRKLDAALLPLTQIPSNCPVDVVEEAVRKRLEENEILRTKLTSSEQQLSNIRNLSLNESLRNFEDSKRSTELQRELTVKDTRISTLEQHILRLQTELDLQSQTNEVKVTENLQLNHSPTNQVLMQAELHKTTSSMKLMEQKYHNDIDRERQTSIQMRVELEGLRSDCDALKAALSQTQTELSRLQANDQRQKSEAITDVAPVQRNYESLYRKMKQENSQLRHKVGSLRRTIKDRQTSSESNATCHGDVSSHALLRDLQRSLYNVSIDPTRLPEETQTLYLTVESFRGAGRVTTIPNSSRNEIVVLTPSHTSSDRRRPTEPKCLDFSTMS